MSIEVKMGDLTEEDADAIVCPANSYMVMGGGVAGWIKKRGGSLIEEEAKGKAPIRIGNALITAAGRLKAKYVIHSPTMDIPGKTNSRNVYLATLAALRCAHENGLKSISFPGMGTGVGGVRLKEAAGAMRRAFEGDSLKITVIARDKEAYEVFRKVFQG